MSVLPHESPKRWTFTSIWNLLTEPSKAIQQPDQRRQAKLLSGLLVFFFLANFVSFIITRITATTPLLTTAIVVYVSSFGVVFLMYLLSRTRHVQLTAFLTVCLLTVIILGSYLASAAPNPTTLYYLIVMIILGSLLLSSRLAFVLMIIDMVIVLLIPRVMPQAIGMVPAAVFLGITGGTIFVFVHFRNLFEKDRQSELTQALKKVEALNAELTQKNNDLLKANALAKESARLKSEFMATMSHELRTPLNAMIGFSSILLEGMGGEIDDDARHMVNRIDSNSKRLLLLINDVLDIAKIEAGRLEIVSVPIEPRKLVETWQSEMSVLAEQKGLIFKTEIDPDLPEKLYGDPERIRQVVANLLSNAFKFTETGGVRLTLKKADDTLLIEVNDTGIGIPPHALNYIFDEFRQVDGSYKRSYGGSGLGLAIVRNLCRMMEGNIRVNSTPGVGSTFTVTLPLKPVEDLIVA